MSDSFLDEFCKLLHITPERRKELERQNAWEPMQGLCTCGHSDMSHWLKEPHGCNGSWPYSKNEKCDCSGYVCAVPRDRKNLQ